jgi:hypothetical protein
MSKPIIVRAIAKPFTAFPRELHEFQVGSDDIVRVWDCIAGHYTACHSMSKRSQARIRRLAQGD